MLRGENKRALRKFNRFHSTSIKNSGNFCNKTYDEPSKNLFRLVFRIKSFSGVLVWQKVIPFVFCHFKRAIRLVRIRRKECKYLSHVRRATKRIGVAMKRRTLFPSMRRRKRRRRPPPCHISPHTDAIRFFSDRRRSRWTTAIRSKKLCDRSDDHK